tara:strand:- start:106483 stop:106944 length:462 start_codon:yes stop_codon:yes gene_type:complete
MIGGGRIPAPALLLGIAGLAPFVWAALMVLGLTDDIGAALPRVLQGDGRLIMLRYGGIILPFMSGALWGFASRANGARAVLAYTISVTPALWWFFVPGSGAGSALINLGFGFAGLLVLDVVFDRWGLAPAWWLALRFYLTAGVLICLAIGIWA